ncbi:MAG: hypothetical protein GEV11_25665 [Streptosporangiales bacterium]|nr:hypothetical protein [Streptosporangiales bacterium]
MEELARHGVPAFFDDAACVRSVAAFTAHHLRRASETDLGADVGTGASAAADAATEVGSGAGVAAGSAVGVGRGVSVAAGSATQVGRGAGVAAGSAADVGSGAGVAAGLGAGMGAETGDEAAAQVLAGAERGPEGFLGEHDGKRLMRAWGLPVVPGRLVRTPSAAAKAAAEIGLPVVVKASSPAVPHKTELGLVELGLRDETDMLRAAEEVLDRAKTAGVAPLDGLLVERMESPRATCTGPPTRSPPSWYASTTS